MATYGYIRVSSAGQAREGNGLEAQRKAVTSAGAEVIYQDVYTGTKDSRPELQGLLKDVKCGDRLVVTKLDRLARSVEQGCRIIQQLTEIGVSVHVLNIGVLDDSPTGRLLMHVMLSFAEFERDLIQERFNEGKAIARQNPDYREGRKPTYSRAQKEHALELLQEHSYKQVENLTGISKSTLIRYKRQKTRFN